jgi:hypothetical protein
MDSKQVRALAERLIEGPATAVAVEGFVRDALKASEALLAQDEDVGGPKGEARFDAVMARLQSTQFYRPTRTPIPEDRVGGAAGEAVEARHAAEVARTKARNEAVLMDIGKAGAAAGIGLSTGNPAAVLPVLEIIGRHILEALGDEPEPLKA